MKEQGWVKLHRKIMDSDMYKQANSFQKSLIVQFLLLAAHVPHTIYINGQTVELMPGQFFMSLNELKNICGRDATPRKLRTGIDYLTKWSFSTSETTNRGHIITILNWDTYQNEKNKNDKRIDKSATNQRQTTEPYINYNKNGKNGEKDTTVFFKNPFEIEDENQEITQE